MVGEKEVEIEIDYVLNEDERTALARGSIEKTEKYDKRVEELKQDRADGRKELKALKRGIDDDNKAFLIGSEPRKVMALASVDMDNKAMNFLDKTTRAVLRTRPLTAQEIEQYGTKPMFEPSAHEDIGHVIKEETKKGKKKDIVAGAN